MHVCVFVFFEGTHACQHFIMRFFWLPGEVLKLVVHISVFLEGRHAREFLSMRILARTTFSRTFQHEVFVLS